MQYFFIKVSFFIHLGRKKARKRQKSPAASQAVGDLGSVVLVLRLHTVEVKQRDQDERGQSRRKSAVIKHKSAVHIRCYRAYRRAQKSRDDAVAVAVFSRDGTQPRRKGKAVYVGLRGKRPRDRKS